MKVKRLESGFLSEEAKPIEGETPKHLVKEAMICYPGKFMSMDGEVEVKEEHLTKLMTNFNTLGARLKRMAGLGEGDEVTLAMRDCPPLQLDHKTTADVTVGRVIGPMRMEEVEIDGAKTKALFCNLKVLGKENVEKVQDGRWVHLSVGADFDEGKLNELTITPFPAAPKASMLSKNDNPNPEPDGSGDPSLNKTPNKETLMSYKDAKEKMAAYKKALSKLMETEKLSEEDADKKLSEMPDEEVSKMAGLPGESEEEKKEKEKKMSRLTAMTANKEKLSASLKNINLAESKVKITSRLSALKSSGKVTPAEIKQISVDEMAGKSDEVINAVLSSYEKRQPVIDMAVYGSVKADSVERLAKNMEKVTAKKKELEVMTRMSSVSPEAKAKAEKELSEMQDDETTAEKIRNEVGQMNNGAEAGHVAMGDLEIIHHMMEKGEHPAAHEELKKLMAKCKALAGGEGVADPASAEKHLSALAEIKKNVEDILKDTDLQIAELK